MKFNIAVNHLLFAPVVKLGVGGLVAVAGGASVSTLTAAVNWACTLLWHSQLIIKDNLDDTYDNENWEFVSVTGLQKDDIVIFKSGAKNKL